MSNFRRGPNVSQYIANLNTVSPQDTTSAEDFLNNDLSGDLGPFLTTEFFDFDMGDNTSSLDNFASPVDSMAPNLGFDQPQSQQSHDFLSENFDFTNFPDLSIPLDTSLQPLPQVPQPFTQLPGPPIRQPIQPFPQETSMPRPQLLAQKSIGEKRAISEISNSSADTPAPSSSGILGSGPQEEGARVAAEEDKRRRNTAASARFRVKKKQREQDLEKRAKEMTEKAGVLESKVQQLEMENRWLKSLITEKDVSVQNFGDLYKAFVTKENADRDAQRADGVGTRGDKRLKLEKA